MLPSKRGRAHRHAHRHLCPVQLGPAGRPIDNRPARPGARACRPAGLACGCGVHRRRDLGRLHGQSARPAKSDARRPSPPPRCGVDREPGSAQPRPRRQRRAAQAARLLGCAHHHAGGRRREQDARCGERPAGQHVPRRPGAEDQARTGGPREGGPHPRRSLLRLRRRARRGGPRQTLDQSGGSRHRAADLWGVRGGALTSEDRAGAQCGGHSRAARWTLECVGAARIGQAPQRPAQQQSLRRPHHLQPPELHQGSGNRPAAGQSQPARAMAHARRARTGYRGPRGV